MPNNGLTLHTQERVKVLELQRDTDTRRTSQASKQLAATQVCMRIKMCSTSAELIFCPRACPTLCL